MVHSTMIPGNNESTTEISYAVPKIVYNIHTSFLAHLRRKVITRYEKKPVAASVRTGFWNYMIEWLVKKNTNEDIVYLARRHRHLGNVWVGFLVLVHPKRIPRAFLCAAVLFRDECSIRYHGNRYLVKCQRHPTDAY